MPSRSRIAGTPPPTRYPLRTGGDHGYVCFSKAVDFVLARCGCTALVVFFVPALRPRPRVSQNPQRLAGAVRRRSSASGDNAECQLCHVDAKRRRPLERVRLGHPRCPRRSTPATSTATAVVSNDEAFWCVELLNSDGRRQRQPDDNVFEIGVSTQPGWTEGDFNTFYFRSGGDDDQQPAAAHRHRSARSGRDRAARPSRPRRRRTTTRIFPPASSSGRRSWSARASRSRQAIDRAEPGTRIFILAGVYRELSNPTNGLNITKNGIRLIGQKATGKRVIFENAGNQRNGIVVVPEDRVDCMSCHSDMAPPFPVLPGVEPGLKMREPMMTGFEIRNITIRGFGTTGSSRRTSTASRSSTSSPSTTGTTGSSRPCRRTGSSATAGPRARTRTAGSGWRPPRTSWSPTTTWRRQRERLRGLEQRRHPAGAQRGREQHDWRCHPAPARHLRRPGREPSGSTCATTTSIASWRTCS